MLYHTCGVSSEDLIHHNLMGPAARVAGIVADVDLLAAAGVLNPLYLPTRYPNRQGNRVPARQFGRDDVLRAVHAARSVMEAARKVAKPS